MADFASLGLPRQLPLALLVVATSHSGHPVVATFHWGHPEVAISQSTRLLMATSARAMAESGSVPTWLPLSEDLYRTGSTRTDASLGHVLSADNMCSSVHNTGDCHVFLPEVRIRSNLPGQVRPEHSEAMEAMLVEVKAS